MFESLPGPLPFLASGKLRALAVTGARRLQRLPQVPTLAELGVRDFEEVGSWWGFVGPAGLPADTVARLNTQLRQAMADAELRATMDAWGIALTPGPASEFAHLLAEENRRWREQIVRLALPTE